MFKRIAAIAIAVAAGTLVACGGRAGNAPGNASFALPAIAPDLAVSAVAPKAAGEDLPSVLGSVYVKSMHAEAGGFTQSRRSQTLAFPPGTKIEVRNLSKTLTHTFDVVMKVGKSPARFPANPKLSVEAHGGGVLGQGYASGPIPPGKSVVITLSNPGVYVVGCAFHYTDGMRDVIRIQNGAVAGPQATPVPKATSSPTSGPTPPGGGW